MTIVEDNRLPKIVMFGELFTGHREREAPKKRFKDSLKKSLTSCNIDHRQWSDLAADRVAWRHTIHQTAAQFEVDRKIHSQTRDRGGRPVPPPPPHQTFLFPAVTPHGPVPLASRSGQSRARLQSTSTWTNFLNLRSRSQAMLNTRLRLLYLLNRK